MTNYAKTFVLLAGLMAMFLGIGQIVGGTRGMVMALLIGGAFNFIMFFSSDRIVLKMYAARVVAPLAQVNPLAAHGGGMLSLFSTHPPTAARVATLMAMRG